MPPQISIARRHLKAYHQQHRLLLQFIWSDLILAHQHTIECVRLNEELKKPQKSMTRNALLHALKVHVTKLAGSAHDYMRLFAWGDEGIFAKLKNYCTLFSQNANDENKEQLELLREANKGWLLALEALNDMQVPLHNEKTLESGPLSVVVAKIGVSIDRMKKLVALLAMPLYTDENVLLFIIRHHEALDRLHGSGFVKKTLMKMYPQGLEASERFLIKKYKARGFTQMIPLIQTAFSKLALDQPQKKKAKTT